MEFVLRLTILACGTPAAAWAHPEVPGAPQAHPIVLEGATLHPVSGPPIEDGMLLFDKGRIQGIGRDIPVPENAERIDLRGQHVYPGLFDAYTELGLVEIESVRATRDAAEIGTLNPNVRAHVAVNPDSELIPVTRSNGVLLALTAPTGGTISGQSAVLQLDGWTYEDLTLQPSVAMHVAWPRMPSVLGSESSNAANRGRALEVLENALRDAKRYRQAKSAEDRDIDVRWEAMLPVLEGKMPIIAAADDLAQIESAVAFAQRHELRMIIYGGYDAPWCAELLKQYNVPVIVRGVYRLPARRDDDFDAAYTLPERLRQAGLKYCISASERFGASGVRNLPYHAATASAYGLPRDEALKAITLYPAEILGVADRVGSLDVGKDATLIITTGDPLETATQVRAAYIQGRRVSLDDRHKRLYRKYREKYRRTE